MASSEIVATSTEIAARGCSILCKPGLAMPWYFRRSGNIHSAIAYISDVPISASATQLSRRFGTMRVDIWPETASRNGWKPRQRRHCQQVITREGGKRFSRPRTITTRPRMAHDLLVPHIVATGHGDESDDSVAHDFSALSSHRAMPYAYLGPRVVVIDLAQSGDVEHCETPQEPECPTRPQH